MIGDDSMEEREIIFMISDIKKKDIELLKKLGFVVKKDSQFSKYHSVKFKPEKGRCRNMFLPSFDISRIVMLMYNLAYERGINDIKFSFKKLLSIEP